MHPRLGSGFMTSLESDWGAYLYPIFSSLLRICPETLDDDRCVADDLLRLIHDLYDTMMMYPVLILYSRSI